MNTIMHAFLHTTQHYSLDKLIYYYEQGKRHHHIMNGVVTLYKEVYEQLVKVYNLKEQLLKNNLNNPIDLMEYMNKTSVKKQLMNIKENV